MKVLATTYKVLTSRITKSELLCNDSSNLTSVC